MAQWKSAISIGPLVEDFGDGLTTLADFVPSVQKEFRANSFYNESDIREAVEGLSDMELPNVARDGTLELKGPDRDSFNKAVSECERRLRHLEEVAARDHRIYVSRTLRHFES